MFQALGITGLASALKSTFVLPSLFSLSQIYPNMLMMLINIQYGTYVSSCVQYIPGPRVNFRIFLQLPKRKLPSVALIIHVQLKQILLAQITNTWFLLFVHQWELTIKYLTLSSCKLLVRPWNNKLHAIFNICGLQIHNQVGRIIMSHNCNLRITVVKVRHIIFQADILQRCSNQPLILHHSHHVQRFQLEQFSRYLPII